MITAKEIMTREVKTAHLDMPVQELAALLYDNKIGGVPVVDDDGRVVGVVTENDLIDQNKKLHIPTMVSFLDSVIFIDSAASFEKEIKKMTGSVVRDVCSEELHTVDEDTGLEDIASLISEKGVHTLPVLKDGKLVGVIGKADLIRIIAHGKK
ncbi:MAG: CBS domain-containing protein [Proteobacteria bacterium]|nr:CBS domain-containing protein [Pseudomonadota bacterium]MBU1639671.1 CBS domain-containing protein [Pseudomonadota bacterium]